MENGVAGMPYKHLDSPSLLARSKAITYFDNLENLLYCFR